MKKMIQKIKTYAATHKGICIATMILMIGLIIVIVVFASSHDNKKSATKESLLGDEQETEDDETSQTQMASVKSPEIEDATKIVSENEKKATGNIFYNQAKGYQFTIPDGYEVYEGDSGIVYIRKPDSTTQIALIFDDGAYRNGIDVYEQISDRIYRISAICRDDNNKLSEKTVKNYGTDLKRDKQVGNFLVKAETGELWLRNTGELDDVIVKSKDYYTIMPDTQKGVILVGISQDVSLTEIGADMDQLLLSLQTYEAPVPDIEFLTFYSSGAEAMQFNYPKDWTVGKTPKGIIYMKAPEDSSSAYAGCIIEYFCDYDKKVVDDYAQYSSVLEEEILLPTFTQSVATSDFQYQSTIQDINLNASIKEKECIYYQIKDTIYPRSNSVKNSLGSLGTDILSRRYTFQASGYHCMLNLIGPNTTAVNALFDQIIASVSCN